MHLKSKQKVQVLFPPFFHSCNGAGPGAYETPRFQSSRSAPSYTLSGRPQDKLRNEAPGPGTYDAANVERSAPAYTLGARRSPAVRNESPGPGTYALDNNFTNQRSAPSYTLSGRADSKIGTESPGPGTYASK